MREDYNLSRKGPIIAVLIGIRKAAQDGMTNQRRIQLACICSASDFCAFCNLRRLLALLESTPSKFLCCTASGKAVTAKTLGSSFRRAAQLFGHKENFRESVTAHSGRITGARLYSRLGVREETIMSFGDWTNVKNFRRYVGVAGLCNNMIRDIASYKPGRPGPLVSQMTEIQLQLPPAVEAFIQHWSSMDHSSFAMVGKRRPRKWHRTQAIGPHDTWRTFCGATFKAEA